MNPEEKTKLHFNRTAANYNNSDDGKFTDGMYDEIVRHIKKVPSGKILDVGCGNANLFSLLPNGKYDLYGIDFCENMIAEAERNCRVDATFEVGDAECLPFGDCEFDIVVCNASFHHYVHPDEVLMEMNRVLKNGGKLLLGDPYVPGLVMPLINILTRFSDEGDYHFYGIGEMERLFVENDFLPVSSYRTGEHTVFYAAEKW